MLTFKYMTINGLVHERRRVREYFLEKWCYEVASLAIDMFKNGVEEVEIAAVSEVGTLRVKPEVLEEIDKKGMMRCDEVVIIRDRMKVVLSCSKKYYARDYYPYGDDEVENLAEDISYTVTLPVEDCEDDIGKV